MAKKSAAVKPRVKFRDLGEFVDTECVLLRDGHVYTVADDGGACPAVQSQDIGGTLVKTGCSSSSNVNGRCMRGYFEWDLGPITDAHQITNVMFRYRVYSVVGSINCHVVPLDIQPSVSSPTAIWNHITDKINANDFILQNISSFATAGNFQLDLGPAADSYFKNKLGVNWGAFAIVYVSQTRDGTDHWSNLCSAQYSNANDRPRLIITHG